MCRKLQCDHCKKWTWAGCGQHIQGIFKTIPVQERCLCGFTAEEQAKIAKDPASYAHVMPKGAGTCSLA